MLSFIGTHIRMNANSYRGMRHTRAYRHSNTPRSFTCCFIIRFALELTYSLIVILPWPRRLLSIDQRSAHQLAKKCHLSPKPASPLIPCSSTHYQHHHKGNMINLHLLISMDTPIPQRCPHMRKINLNLLLTPLHHRRQQVQAPPFDALLPVNPIVLAQLLEPLIRRPSSYRQLPAPFYHVDKACCFEPRTRFVDCAEGFAELVAEL
jgi:hypothetical protein